MTDHFILTLLWRQQEKLKNFYRSFFNKLRYNTQVHYCLKYLAFQYKNEIKYLISVKEDAGHPHGDILTKVSQA